MALIDRLAGLSDPETSPRLPLEYFHASLYELAQGFRTRQQIIDGFGLSVDEVAELDWLIGRYNAQPNATAKARFVEVIRVVFVMAEAGAPGYTTNADLVARIQAI